jgi:FAD/FMN-containing dehydrogenase
MIMNKTTAALYAKDIDNILEGDVSILAIDRERLARDTSLFYVKPAIVVYPKNSRDISKLISYVAHHKEKDLALSVTMRAAGTCMTGGPLTESIVVDTTKYMNQMLAVTDTYATAQPGMYYRDFEKQTLAHGWIMPSYPASRELAALGGIVLNNSGGEKTLTYGKTERYVKELAVVYANGEEDTVRALTKEQLDVKMAEQTESGRIHRELFALITQNYDVIKEAKPRVSKNSSGYYLWNVYDKTTGIFDIVKLIVGSQGTLACVTSATLTGAKPKTHSRMLVMFVPSTSRLGEIIPKILLHKPETLESYDDHTFKIAIKFFKDIALRMGGSMFSLGLQFLPEFWMVLTGGVPKVILMAEFTGDTEEDVEKQVAAAEQDMKQFNLPLRRTKNEQEAKKYWTFRRESFNLLRQKLSGLRTAPTTDDIIVHPTDLPTFLPKLDVIFAKYDLVYTVAGHMGDANFHIIPLVDIHKKGIVTELHKLMDEVYDLVFQYGGSMSAEHNDGLLRTAYLPKMFSPDIISLFEQTKTIFDPQNILNPGKKVFGDKAYAWKHVDTK